MIPSKRCSSVKSRSFITRSDSKGMKKRFEIQIFFLNELFYILRKIIFTTKLKNDIKNDFYYEN